MLDLSVQLAPLHRVGLKLSNPVMTASGTFGYGPEFAELIDIQNLGAMVCKGTTLRPRIGNPQPRIAEVDGGMLNSIGLENIGVDAVVADKAPLWAGWKVPVVVNIAGENLDEYRLISSRLSGVVGVAAIEVNISCPNMAQGGMEFGTDPRNAAGITKAVKSATDKPVIVKLSPNVTSIVDIACAVTEAGADALTLINTLKGMSIDIKRRRAQLGARTGGLSGPAIKPVALYMVNAVSKMVDVPVIGCGGIMTWQDALEFIMAGADAVQVGSASFANPSAALDVIKGIAAFMEAEGVNNVRDLVGAAG
jgi:dihydroorotate dehydrogenase (NAD+) catalytic subunit